MCLYVGEKNANREMARMDEHLEDLKKPFRPLRKCLLSALALAKVAKDQGVSYDDALQ